MDMEVGSSGRVEPFASRSRRRGFRSSKGPSASFDLSPGLLEPPSITGDIRASVALRKWEVASADLFYQSRLVLSDRGALHEDPHRILPATHQGSLIRTSQDRAVDCEDSGTFRSSERPSQIVGQFRTRGSHMTPPTVLPELLSPSCDSQHKKPLLKNTDGRSQAGPKKPNSLISAETSFKMPSDVDRDEQRVGPGAGNHPVYRRSSCYRPPPILCESPNSRPPPDAGLAFCSPVSEVSGFSSSYESSTGSEWSTTPNHLPARPLEVVKSSPATLHVVDASPSATSGVDASPTERPSCLPPEGETSPLTRPDQADSSRAEGSRQRGARNGLVVRARGFERPLPRPAILCSPSGGTHGDALAGPPGDAWSPKRGSGSSVPPLGRADQSRPESRAGRSEDCVSEALVGDRRVQLPQFAGSLPRAGVLRLRGEKDRINRTTSPGCIPTDTCVENKNRPHYQGTMCGIGKVPSKYWTPWRSGAGSEHAASEALEAAQEIDEPLRPSSSPDFRVGQEMVTPQGSTANRSEVDCSAVGLSTDRECATARQTQQGSVTTDSAGFSNSDNIKVRSSTELNGEGTSPVAWQFMARRVERSTPPAAGNAIGPHSPSLVPGPQSEPDIFPAVATRPREERTGRLIPSVEEVPPVIFGNADSNVGEDVKAPRSLLRHTSMESADEIQVAREVTTTTADACGGMAPIQEEHEIEAGGTSGSDDSDDEEVRLRARSTFVMISS